MNRTQVAGRMLLGSALLAGSMSALAVGLSSALVTIPAGASLTMPSGSLTLGCADLDLRGTLSVGSSQVGAAGNVVIAAGATLDGGAGTLAVGGSWVNNGSFIRGASTVVFADGCSTSPAQFSGSTRFANLTFASSLGRTFIIPAGDALYVSGVLTLAGVSGTPIQVASAVPAQPSRILLRPGASASSADATLGTNVAIDATSLGAVADFNGDGKSDILYRNATTGQVYRMLMNGLAIANEALAYTEPDTAWKVVANADFNGEWVTDLLWRNDSTGMVVFMPFDGSGLPAGDAIVMSEPSPAWKIVHTPDLDGDGEADILWWNSSTGQVYAMLMSGGTIGTQGFVYTEANTAWKIVAAGDFAGNGRSNQLLWRNGTSGQVYLMTVTVSGGVFSQTGVMIFTEANTAWRIIAAADFNGDGKSDILWRNAVTGQVYLMQMNGPAIAAEALVYTEANTAWKIVAQGDFDGNGKADLLWRNDGTGQVYMMLMNGFSIASQGMVYTEPNTAWKVLGPWEYGQDAGILATASSDKSMPSTLQGESLNRGMIGGYPANPSPGISGGSVNPGRLPDRVLP